MPTISAIVPVYNREPFVAATLENLLRQTQPPDEIIVVDDGSTDRSVEVVRSFGDKIKLIQQTNQGVSAARNAALDVARGDYLQFQDSDDLLSLNKIEAQARVMTETGADIVYGPWVKFEQHGTQVKLNTQVIQQDLPPPRLSKLHWLLRGWFNAFPANLVRRSFLESVGRFRTDLVICEDSELFFRCLLRKPVCAFCPDGLMLYRDHQHNKLTRNQGTSSRVRAEAWALSFRYYVEGIQREGIEMDWFTRDLFFVQLNQGLDCLRRAHSPRTDLVQALEEAIGQRSRLYLRALEYRMYFRDFLRWAFVSGTFWRPVYRPGRPTAAQLQRIADLGFTVV